MTNNPRTELPHQGIQDEEKTREQLVEELAVMRQRVAELEAKQRLGQVKNSQEKPPQEKPPQEINGEKQRFETWLIDILNSAIASIVRFRAFDPKSWQPEYYSAGSKVVYGYSSEELMENPQLWSSRVLPDDMNAVISPLFEKIFHEKKITVEYRFLHRNGSWRWISSTYTAEQNQTANCWHITVVNVDVTNLKQVEMALRDSEERFRQLAEHLDAVFWIISSESNQVLYLSPACEAIFGEVGDRLYGQPRLFLRMMCQSDRKRVTAILKQLIRGESAEVEYRIRRSDGRLRWIHTRAFPVRNEAGQIYRYAGICQDITQRKQAEQTLRATEARFSRAFRSSPDAISIITLTEGRIIDINDSFLDLFGFKREEVIGRTTAELEIWSNLEDRTKLIQLLQGGDDSCNYECELRTKSGAIKTVLASSELIHLDGQDCVLTLSKDITERKQAERSLQNALKREQDAIERERFIAKIAQTIRQFLDLNQILNTTVAEVRRFLQIDRVIIYRFRADWGGQIVAESVSDPEFSLLDRVIHDSCFSESMIAQYRQGRIHWINDVSVGKLQPCYAELLSGLNVRAALIIPILVKQELWGLLVAHQCMGPRQWQEFNWLLLQQLSTQLAIGIYQAELYQQIRQQAHREQALSQVIQDIRNSLDLNTIFATATSEVGQLLLLDRAEIVQYLPEQRLWLNVASYRRTTDLPNALGMRLSDDNNQYADRLKRGEVVRVASYSNEGDATNPPFVQDYPGSWLLVPLEVGGRLWGNLSLNHSQSSWCWKDWEVDLACAVANQLAIAIQQSELYTEIQELNEDLEQLVEFRTAQLQQALEFEALLKRITDRVRDSLDEQQILQSAVAELTHGLKLLGCNAALYDLEQQSSTVYFEYISAALPSTNGKTFNMTNLVGVYQQLLRGQSTQFCNPRAAFQELAIPRNGFAILACPMIDNSEVVGDLWLFKSSEAIFDNLEIRLAQQVANHCAIALRQSHLYQAAQAQVEELERLNRLKDDFLSTVSHELRTPISSIKMATQMLEILIFGEEIGNVEESPGEHQHERLSAQEQSNTGNEVLQSSVFCLPNLPDVQRMHRYFHILRDECDREIRLVNDLLALSRLDADTEPLFLTTINLQLWISHVAESFVALTRNQQQQLEINLRDDLPEITTDLSDLERVFTELLNNACKYTPAGERIIVSVQVEKSPLQCFLLSITNTGVEISERERDLIFEKFYRIPNNDPWKYGGTGLGLALVKKLLNRLNGTIHVDSGSGQTTFTVRLPFQHGEYGMRNEE